MKHFICEHPSLQEQHQIERKANELRSEELRIVFCGLQRAFGSMFGHHSHV